MTIPQIPANSVAIKLARNITRSAQNFALQLVEKNAGTKTYTLRLEFDFIADIVTDANPVDPGLDNFVAFGKNPGSIFINGSSLDMYFTDDAQEAILLEADAFSTTGVKVRSGDDGFSPARLLKTIASLGEEEKKQIRALLEVAQ